MPAVGRQQDLKLGAVNSRKTLKKSGFPNDSADSFDETQSNPPPDTVIGEDEVETEADTQTLEATSTAEEINLLAEGAESLDYGAQQITAFGAPPVLTQAVIGTGFTPAVDVGAFMALPGVAPLATRSVITFQAPASQDNDTPTTTPLSIVVQDGYLDGAEVWVDLNDNAVIDPLIDYKFGVSINGVVNGSLSDAHRPYALITTGGTDISTGLPFEGSYSATSGSTVVNPLTSLVQSMVQSSMGSTAGMTDAEKLARINVVKAEALVAVNSALGLPAGADLTSIDTVSTAMASADDAASGISLEQALEINSKALMVANIMAMGAAALQGASTSSGGVPSMSTFSNFIAQGIVDAIKTASASGEMVALGDESSLTAILETASTAATTAATQAGGSFAMDSTKLSAAKAAVATSVASTNSLIGALTGEAIAANAISAGSAGGSLTQMLAAQKAVLSQLDELQDNNVSVLNTFTDAAAVFTESQKSENTTGLKLGTQAVSAPTVVADTTAATVTKVTVEPTKVGDLARFVVEMSEGLVVKFLGPDKPAIAIQNTANSTATAAFDRGASTGKKLVFNYKVREGDTQLGIAPGTTIVLPDTGFIRDLGRNDANLSLDSGLTEFKAAEVIGRVVDTQAPGPPTIGFGAGVSDGATSTEASQSTGVLTITAETGASTLVTFTNGDKKVSKAVTGNGATAVPVVLSAEEVTALGEGTVSVSAVATDSAGNASTAGTSSFTLATETDTLASVAVSWATSFDEGALSSKLNMDVPNPELASVVLDTVNHRLDFSARGLYGLDAYYYRDDAPIVWADLPEVQLGQSWSVQTRVSINDGLAVPEQSAGIVFYDADGGVPNFYFSLTKWIQPTYSLSDVAAAATQSGGANGISGEAYSLLAPETSDVYLKVQVTELGQTDHYQFFYKGLLAQDPWIAVGDARTYTSKGNDSRVGLFYKTNQVTAGATFDDFAITVPVSVAENSTGTVYIASATADNASTLTYALSGTDSDLFSINANSGEVAFLASPNFENPVDADGDNLYDLTVTVSDGVESSMPQSVVIAVTNVAEPSEVNVTVAPAQVTEGDAGKLFFTFTRSNDLDHELTVNIDVTGTAETEDYSRPLQSQSTHLLGASRYQQVPTSAAVGADGAVYVSGRADSSLLDGTNVLSEYGGGYVKKFDTDGSLEWTRLTDAVNDNYPYSVTTGTDGGVYVAGMAYNPDAYYDGFVTKFDPAGLLEWTSFVGGPGLEYDYIKSVSTDASGAVYVAGLSYDVDWTKASPFISKLDNDGDLAWTRPVTFSDSPVISVSPAADGAVYVTGYSNSAIYDGTTLLSDYGSYVSKYDADGNLKWTRLPDASGYGQTSSVSAGADGAVYVAGYSYGSILNGDVSQGGQDGFVTKFNAGGNLVWTRLVSGSGNDSVKAVFAGSDGAIYVAGETYSSLNGQIIRGEPNTTNGFVVKLDADDGALAWTHLIGGSSNDLITSVSADADGVVYIAGETYSSSLNGQNNQGNVAGFVSKILPASLTQITFAPGSATATLALKATSDTLIEGNETITVTVKQDQAYTAGSSASATGTIEDKPESDGNSVNINSRTDGNISVVGEKDLYSIQLTEGEKYIFTLEANSSELNAGLNLFTTRSASSESLLLTNDNAFYLNNNARITYTAQETGTYYIQANGASETSGGYVLSVSDSDVPTPELEFQIPSTVTGDLTTEISWRSQEFYLYVNTPSNSLPDWENSNAPVKPTLVEVNGSGSFVELWANIIDWGRPTIQAGTLQEVLPDTNYVYTIARGAIKDSNGLTNDYYESRIFHTSADTIGPVAMQGGVAMGIHDVDYNYLTGFSSLDVAMPGQTLSIPKSPDTLFVQFNEPVRWPAGGWNQEWSAAASNGVIDGVYLKEGDLPVYEFGVAYIPDRSNYEVGNIHLDLVTKTGSGTSNNDEAIWLDLRHGFKSGYDYERGINIDVPVGYTLKEDVKYTLVFDVGMYDPMLNFSNPTTPPFEFSFIINPTQPVVDTTAPTLGSTTPAVVASTIAGTAGNSLDETISLTLTFDGNVNGLTSVTDNTIFTVAGSGIDATWSGTGNARTLTYTITAGQNGQAAINEVALKSALVAGITDAAGNLFAYSGSIPNIDLSPLPVVDTTAPTATHANGAYLAGSDTLIVTGTNFSTLLEAGENASTDIKARLDWTKLLWDINGDDGTTTNVGFVEGDITSAKVSNGTTLTIVLSASKATALEATAGYAGTTLDTLDIAAGFARDAAGNAASTDAMANAPLFTQAGQSVIDLGSYGQLIAPVQVEGKWYYHWDRNDNGSSTGDYYNYNASSGFFPLSEIYNLFKQDINGDTGSSTNNTHRYATVIGIKLALPTLGAQFGDLYSRWDANYELLGTTLADPSQTNDQYGDLSAIWDAYNGTLVGQYTGQGLNGDNRGSGNVTSGAPAAWFNDTYISATPWGGVRSDYAALRIYDGLVFPYDIWGMNIAVEVVDTIAPTLGSTTPVVATSTLSGTAGNSAGETISLTLTFDGNVNGLTSVTDNTIFTVGGSGVDATWSGTGNARTLTYTITAGQDGQAAIDEAALKAALIAGITDAAGNAFAYSGDISNIDASPLPVVDTRFDAAKDFIAGPTEQSANNIWQYFSADYSNSNLSNLQLLSNWDTDGNGLIGLPQWDGNRTDGNYPFVQKQSNGDLIVHPDDTGKAVVVAWKNTTASNVTVDLTGSLNLVGNELLSYAPSSPYGEQPSNDGITYLVTTSSTAYASGTPTVLLSGALDENNSTSSPDNINLLLSSQTLAPGAMISVAVHGNSNYFWDHTQLDLQITPRPATIDLGSYGQLIAPVQVEGKWFYYWDRDKDGLARTDGGSYDTGDWTSHDALDGLFNQDINGVVNTTVANLDGQFGTTDTYRYGTLNGVRLALPTLNGEGGVSSEVAAYIGYTEQPFPGTGYTDAGATSNGTVGPYDDFTAIWDAYNGTGTGFGVGIPPGWPTAEGPWTATPGGSGHLVGALHSGGVWGGAADEYSKYYVALQVL